MPVVLYEVLSILNPGLLPVTLLGHNFRSTVHILTNILKRERQEDEEATHLNIHLLCYCGNWAGNCTSPLAAV
jgi:hypothetical protein